MVFPHSTLSFIVLIFYGFTGIFTWYAYSYINADTEFEFNLISTCISGSRDWSFAILQEGSIWWILNCELEELSTSPSMHL
jgi:hypothetical protein